MAVSRWRTSIRCLVELLGAVAAAWRFRPLRRTGRASAQLAARWGDVHAARRNHSPLPRQRVNHENHENHHQLVSHLLTSHRTRPLTLLDDRHPVELRNAKEALKGERQKAGGLIGSGRLWLRDKALCGACVKLGLSVVPALSRVLCPKYSVYSYL